MSESFAELFEESLKSLDMQPGAIITGIVVDIDGDWVTVHAGLKSEGVIPVEQFYNEQGELTIKVGDEVHVALDAVEDGFGETKLSREKAKRAESWIVLEAAFAADEVVKGVINGKVKGGFTVDVNGIRAFLPGSLVDVRPVRDTTHLEGKELEFKVIKLDQKRNNVVVSRRSVLEAENSAEREALLESLQEGQQVKGIVKNLTDYGAFVDLGGVDGLLHITDMAWKRIKHPSEIVNVGDEIDVKVLKFDRERNRVSLGLKQLGEDPWVAIKARYPEGTRVMARVTNLTDYGCFAELEEGVEGLVHVSEMDWTNKNIHPSKVVQVGDEVEVQVLDIDEERRRISWVSSSANPTRGKTSPASSTRVTVSPVPSSRSPTSVSSSVWTAASTAWSTCPTSPGTKSAKKPYVASRRATSWKPSSCRSTRSASASPWVSSSWKTIRSPTTRPCTRKAASSAYREGSRRQGRCHQPGRRHRRYPEGFRNQP